MNKSDWIAHLLTWQDVPYHHQQYSRFGADCAGLFIGCALELGYDWRSYDMPERTPEAQGWKLVEYIEKLCKPVEVPEPGDLLVFRVRVDPQHCAVLLPNDRIIHASSAAGKVTVIGFDQRWKDHQVGAFELPL